MKELTRQFIHLNHNRLPLVALWKRCTSSFKKQMLKRELKKEEINKYTGENEKKARRLYVWGYAATGALGIQSYMNPDETKNQRPLVCQLRPARLQYADINSIKVTSIDCGYGFTVFSGKKGNKHVLYGTGVNTDSQIGYHEFPRKSGCILDYLIEPGRIDLPLLTPDTTKILKVACGRAHTLVLTDKEGLFSLGSNAYGQCGRTTVPDEQFSKNPRINNIKSIPDDAASVVCGQDHSLILTESGDVYSCGLGADGQTGLGTYTNCDRIEKVNGDISGEKIVQISSVADCVLAVSERGDLFGWGNSEYNQLSSVTDETQVNSPRHLNFSSCGRIIKAVAGGSICGVLNDHGQVFVWGYGILGKGPKLESSSYPQEIPPTLFGRNELNTDTKVTDIECGVSHFAATTDNYDLYTWGLNKKGCLGLSLKDDKRQYFPLKVSLPAEVHSVRCGVDHMVVSTRSFC